MIFNILLLFFHSESEVNCSTIFVLGNRVNMTKKHMDDRLHVCFPVTPKKQQKLHPLLLAPFSLTKHLLVC